MRNFVYEYLCALGAGADSSLAAEGWAMLTAVLADFARLPGAEAITLLPSAGPALPPGVAVRRTAPADEGRAFRELAAACDFSLVIAPECGGLLEERCRWVEEAGGRLLGPASGVVRLTADKLALAQALDRAGVPSPPTAPLAGGAPAVGFPAVCKPRDGAGSQATFLVRGADEVPACVARARAEGWDGALLMQRFVPGRAASVAFLIGPAAVVALAPAAQDLSADGRFHYRGGSLPLSPAEAARAVRLARRAVAAVAGLAGYIGVDLVLGSPEDGSEDRVIEINPRLTTSYVGLRALAEGNLAEALVRVVRGEAAPVLRWRSGAVTFRADGEVVPGA
jgi:predicted ATP-grasp superfamily ATP-dependent carboligase